MKTHHDTEVTQQWEYHHERWDQWPSLAQGMQRLTNLGEDGWELVTFWDFWDRDHGGGGLWAIFKRARLLRVAEGREEP